MYFLCVRQNQVFSYFVQNSTILEAFNYFREFLLGCGFIKVYIHTVFLKNIYNFFKRYIQDIKPLTLQLF